MEQGQGLRYLGDTKDNQLNWKINIEEIMKTLCRSLYALRMVKPYCTQESVLMANYANFYRAFTVGLTSILAEKAPCSMEKFLEMNLL